MGDLEIRTISLMSHTIGSIGQVVKEVSLLSGSYSDTEAIKEVRRIYDGYVNAITQIMNTPKTVKVTE